MLVSKEYYANLSRITTIPVSKYLNVMSTKIKFNTTTTFHIFRAVRIIGYMYREHIIDTVSYQFVCTTPREVEIFAIECFVMVLTPRVAQIWFICKIMQRSKILITRVFVLMLINTQMSRKWRMSGTLGFCCMS